MSTFEQLKELFADMADEDIDVSSITPESRIVEDIGFSSFNMIWMAFAISREYDIDIIKMNDWKPVTVQDICDKINEEIKK